MVPELRFTDEHYKRPLTERWNVAMTHAGFVGSEWIDEPERIAQRMADIRKELLDAKLELARLRRKCICGHDLWRRGDDLICINVEGCDQAVPLRPGEVAR